MPYESEDEAGWDALPDVSDDEEVPAEDSIGPLHTGAEPYSYRLQQLDRTLTIASQPDKVAHPHAQQTPCANVTSFRCDSPSAVTFNCEPCL